MPSRATTPNRRGTGANNLDSRGRVNRFNRTPIRAMRNFWRRRSSGGAGG